MRRPFLAVGAHTRYDVPGVISILRGRTDELAALLNADPALLHVATAS
jgi:hypothetical protein